MENHEPFPKRQIFYFSELKEFPDKDFKYNEKGGKFSKRVEHTVGKGEIVCNKQFLLFPQRFQQIFFKRIVHQASKSKGVFGKGFKIYLLSLYNAILSFNDGGVVGV